MQQWELYMKTYVHFIIAGDKICHKIIVVQHSILLNISHWHAAQEHTKNAYIYVVNQQMPTGKIGFSIYYHLPVSVAFATIIRVLLQEYW